MEYIVKTSRCFYAVALIIYGIQQFIYGDFRNVFLPEWQTKLILLPVWAYLFGVMLIAVGAAVISGKMAREALLIFGGILLGFLCFVHIPYELTSEPHSSWHLGVWGNALKTLALSGGAFVMAATFPENADDAQNKSAVFKFLEKIIPLGEIFFSITMICFGTTHFLYPEPTAALVPEWIPDKLSWTYFAGVALICSGAAIILDIRKKIIAALLGLMILSWFFLLHLPSALANPYLQRGNSLASAFDALAFSGIAFVIAFAARAGKKDELS